MDKGTKILVVVNSILILALIISYFIFFQSTSKENKKINLKLKENQVISDHDALQDMIRLTLGEETNKFSLYLFRPQIDEQPLIFQSRPMRPASMIKLFVLAKVMQDAKDGQLALDELIPISAQNIVGGAGSIAGEGVGAKVPIRQAAELMIIESDNTATNILIDRIGMENLNQYISEKGYKDTIFNHKMMLQTNNSNMSSAEDIGLLFNRIYNHECVDDYYDRLMIDYLLRQEDKDCFPAALPYWNIAHKTGEVNNLYDDGGIFYGSKGDFILVIMDDDYESRGETIEKMQRIASQIAENFMSKK